VRTSHRPAALDDLGRALVEQFEPDGAAEFARPIGRAGARNLDEQPPASSSTDAVSVICGPRWLKILRSASCSGR
jgi:hypothetical protein